MPWQEPVKKLNTELNELEERLDTKVDRRLDHIDGLLAKLAHQLQVRWIIALVGIILACGWIYIVAHQAHTTAKQARVAVTDIAILRHQTIIDTCVDQNKRHDNTVATLNQRYQQFEAGAHDGHLAQLQASKDFTIALINDLAPKQNCTALANTQAPLPSATP